MTSVSANVSVQHSPQTTFSVDVTHAHVSTEPVGAERLTLSNGQIGHFKFEHDARGASWCWPRRPAHSHENLVMPGAIKRYQKVQAGLNYTF